MVQGAERFFERAEVRQAMVGAAGGRALDPGRDPAGRAPWSRRCRRSAGRPTQPPPGGAARERGRRWPRWSRWPRSSRARRLLPIGEARPSSASVAADVHRGAGRGGRRSSTRRRSRGDARVAALGQGAGVGRGLPGRARRGHAADRRTRRRPSRSRRSGGCSTSGSPGPGSGSGCRTPWPARPAAGPGGRPGSCRSSTGPARRAAGGGGVAALQSRSRQARARWSSCRVCGATLLAGAGPQARPLRRPARPTSTRSCSSGCASGGPRVAGGAEGPGVRGVHRRHADRAGRAPAGPRRRS